jgi:hypothetical protein
MKVTCINDKNQPQGAEVVKDTEYNVLEQFINSTGQQVYLIAGINNKGTTKMGFPWYGYNAERFAKTIKTKARVQAVEYDLALN